MISFLRLLQLLGDLLTLERALGRKRLDKSKHLGHCSGLVKLFPGGLDIGISQVAWYSYDAMLRVYKLYDFNYHLMNFQGECDALVPVGFSNVGRFIVFSILTKIRSFDISFLWYYWD